MQEFVCDALTERLTHPRHEIPKHYHVRIKGSVTKEQLETLCRPFLMDGYETRPVEVTVLSRTSTETVLNFTLFEGRNRQIRRMCEAVELPILQLTRVAIGRIAIGDLAVGRYRALTPDEVNYLKGGNA
jgi:23S rRNA pseudouridine2605 synthase